ncbi:MAG: hypothetical protein MZV63_50915 [Marinilabiliales bacterium]|nr:hypothetical protein [Marinilabiliales bacterium]
MEKTQPEKRGSIFRKVSIDGNAGPTIEMSSAPMSTPTNKRTITAFWLFRSICMSTEISEEKWSMNFVQIKHKQTSRLKVCAVFISRAAVSSYMSFIPAWFLYPTLKTFCADLTGSDFVQKITLLRIIEATHDQSRLFDCDQTVL